MGQLGGVLPESNLHRGADAWGSLKADTKYETVSLVLIGKTRFSKNLRMH